MSIYTEEGETYISGTEQIKQETSSTFCTADERAVVQ